MAHGRNSPQGGVAQNAPKRGRARRWHELGRPGGCHPPRRSRLCAVAGARRRHRRARRRGAARRGRGPARRRRPADAGERPGLPPRDQRRTCSPRSCGAGPGAGVGGMDRARAGDRPAGAFSFGASKATVETALAVLGVPFRTITPATWKRAAGIPAGKGMKDLARSRAIERWPQHAEAFARREGSRQGRGRADRVGWAAAGRAGAMRRRRAPAVLAPVPVPSTSPRFVLRRFCGGSRPRRTSSPASRTRCGTGSRWCSSSAATTIRRCSSSARTRAWCT